MHFAGRRQAACRVYVAPASKARSASASFSCASLCVVTNPDTSVDVYFGPKAPLGKEANWVQTWPGKGWSVILRLCGPEQAFFDKTWKPGEFEELTAANQR